MKRQELRNEFHLLVKPLATKSNTIKTGLCSGHILNISKTTIQNMIFPKGVKNIFKIYKLNSQLHHLA